MKITIRKKDSVTSAVLFIFNIIGEYKSNYSIRLDSLLELIQIFNKSETSIRTSLSRMVSSGILINRKEDNQIFFDLAQKGLDNIALWNRGLSRFYSRFALRNRGWDGQWNILSIADFNKSDYSNQIIVDDLYECGLREFNSNIWSTPYRIEEEIMDQLTTHGFHYYSFCGRLSTDMNLASLLDDVFELNVLKQKYADFLFKTKDSVEAIKSQVGKDLLPVLFSIGWDFYDIVTADPALPKELYQLTEEDEAVELMKAIRTATIKKIFDYLKVKDI